MSAATDIQEHSREYQDRAAADLYTETNAHKLIDMHVRIMNVLEHQTAKLEQYPATPHTASQADTISSTMHVLAHIQAQIERWHQVIYPNQRT